MYFHYQPIYINNRISYLEALLRFEDSSINIEEFVMSQKNKVDFDLMILSKVLSEIQTSKFDFFSINISLLSLESDIFTYKCIELINKNKKTITLELTEYDKSSNLEQIHKNISQIKEKTNCKFALDDFGKGCANIDLLINLPIDIVKIDRCITQRISDSFSGFNLLKNIIYKLTTIFKKDIVVEGVENESEVKLLENISNNIKCQGYFFARPSLLNFFTFIENENENENFIDKVEINVDESFVMKLEKLIYQLTINEDYEVIHSDYENIFFYESKPQEIKNKARELLKNIGSSKMVFMAPLMMSSSCAVIIRDVNGYVVYNNDLHIDIMKMDLVGIEPNKLISLYDFYKSCLELDNKLICSQDCFSYEEEYIEEINAEYHIFRQKIINDNNVYIISSIYRGVN
ncbi:EAL domain-containing protein [Photobacterium toruni]|uniref:EAL domain-containing protein n=1 Tax=Photobacterium toruni TaxID=1935446 RepID=UPI002E1809F2|nr:EAL domain-containing protein [Photobacterium toruni]